MKRDRRFKHSYDGITVWFDEGDIVATKYGDIDRIVKIDAESRTVYFQNIDDLDFSRISSRTSLNEYKQCLKRKAYKEGFKPKSIVSFVDNNNEYKGEIISVHYSKAKFSMYIRIAVNDTIFEKFINDVKMIDVYMSTEEKVVEVMDKYLYHDAFGFSRYSDESINKRKEFIKEMVDLIDGRKKKLNRIIPEF